MRDKLIDWNGKQARLEIAFDITDHDREKESFKILASANGLNVECIRVLENDDLDAALNAVLGMVGEFLQADRTYIFNIVSPVSYTHLDVYKRQVRCGAFCSSCFWFEDA